MTKEKEANIEKIKSILENDFIDKGIAEPEDYVYIRSSHRYYNFFYGIFELKGLLYHFVLNLHTNEITQGKIEGDRIGSYGEKDLKGNECNEEYIYERLEPDEILIISREGNSFLTAKNENGELCLERIKVDDEKRVE